MANDFIGDQIGANDASKMSFVIKDPEGNVKASYANKNVMAITPVGDIYYALHGMGPSTIWPESTFMSSTFDGEWPYPIGMAGPPGVTATTDPYEDTGFGIFVRKRKPSNTTQADDQMTKLWFSFPPDYTTMFSVNTQMFPKITWHNASASFSGSQSFFDNGTIRDFGIGPSMLHWTKNYVADPTPAAFYSLFAYHSVTNTFLFSSGDTISAHWTLSWS